MRRLAFSIALALALVVATGATADPSLWLHVRVDEADGGAKVEVNVPFNLIRTALPMIDLGSHVHGHAIHLDDRRLSYAELRELWLAVRSGPDMEFVTIEDDEDSVRVWKEQGHFFVRVNDRNGERVDVRMPIAVVDAFLTRADDFDVEAAIAVLAEHGEGELVTVRGDDESVRVWVDRRPEASE